MRVHTGMNADRTDSVRSDTAGAGADPAAKPRAGTVVLAAGAHSSGSHAARAMILIMRKRTAHSGPASELSGTKSPETRVEHD